MLTNEQVRDVIGSDAYDPAGDKIGRADEVYLDDDTGRPEFVAVHTGLFGMNTSLVPIAEASYENDRLVLPYDKDRIKGAPNIKPDSGHLSPDEEQTLYDYYGMAYSSGNGRHSEGEDVSGPETDEAMTRSEERLSVGTQQQEAGRARLRKYVVTEEVQQTVPVRRERAVVEREPITDGNVDQAMSGADLSEEEHEVVLHQETPVVEKRTEPVERVRLSTETEVDQETISEDVRKERIEAEGELDRRDR
ncbi:PRC and DUF2382 domain-containing protein [Kribbella sancticallisti]|uniref:PRC and DUF2382 domain-containing protein n=1 Tax=Kribbella sancticallisti TaxID=460087 RepID=A0ABP4PN93_9ACTN